MYQALQPTSFQIARKEYRVVLKILANGITVIPNAFLVSNDP
jgi:hypothetical protein